MGYEAMQTLKDMFYAFLLLLKSRIPNTFFYSWTAAIGALLASHGSPKIFPFVLTVLALFFLSLSVYIYNDIMDAEMDKLNPTKRKRPYASGKVSKKQAMSFVYINLLIGILFSFLVSFQVALLCSLWTALFILYSNPRVYLKRRILIKEGTPALGISLSTIIGANSVGPLSLNVIYAAVFWGLLIFVSVPAFRDTTDLEEDRKFGVKSLASIISWKRRLEIVITFFLVVMTVTPLTYVYFGFNVLFPIIMVAMSLAVLRFMIPLLKGFDEKNLTTVMRAGTVYAIITSISMVLGSLPINVI